MDTLLKETVLGALARPKLPNRPAQDLLRQRGFRSPDAAARQLTQILLRAQDPEIGERLAEALLTELDACADPDLALAGMARWTAALATPRTLLRHFLEDPRFLADLVALFACSVYAVEVLERDPYAYDALLAPDEDSSPLRFARAIDAVFRTFITFDSRLAALRRLRHQQTVAIAWRDITGRASFTRTVRDISDLAQAIVQAALRLCRESAEDRKLGRNPTGQPSASLPFAVFGMGKLGGRELNYSSDIDLLFVTDSGPDGSMPEGVERLAERLVNTLSEVGPDGYLYRTDMRLRPEGRYGPLIRTLASYRDYYEHWMQPWERQALIKARFIAGDEDLGRRFAELVGRLVYQPGQSLEFLEDIRATKEAMEAKVVSSGEAETNVKEGRGAIRDIEFALQFLQLAFGGENPDLRCEGSLEALDRLWRAGILPLSDVEVLREAYLFLRTVEHRLQLLEDQPVRNVPTDPEERAKLARRMGYSRGEEEGFDRELKRHRDAVREVFTNLFNLYGEEEAPQQVLRGLLLAIETDAARSQLREVLAELGFRRPERGVEALARLAGAGAPLSWQARRSLSDLVGPLVHAAARTADPDGALRLLDVGAWQKELRDPKSPLREPAVLETLCRLGASGTVVPELLAEQPALREEVLRLRAPARGPALSLRAAADLAADLGVKVAMAPSAPAALDVVRRFRKQELLRIAIVDALGPEEEGGAGPAGGFHAELVTEALSDLADTCLEAVLRVCARRVREAGHPDLPLDPSGTPLGFALLGMGRLGGRELNYSSDLDLICLCDDSGGVPHTAHERLAEAVYAALNDVSSGEGRLYEADFRLRPEGKSGPMSASLEACRRYYRERAMTWEKQALLKARRVAGDPEVADRFLALVEPLVYPPDPSPTLVDEVRAMKRRVERERVGDAQRGSHIKLGPGGLSDIEWTVQLLQMLHGAANPRLRCQSTVGALRAFREAAAGAQEPLLTPEEVGVLLEAYDFYVHLRNHLYLRTGLPQDALPADAEELEVMARLLGCGSGPDLMERHRRHAAAVRAIANRRFWGREG